MQDLIHCKNDNSSSHKCGFSVTDMEISLLLVLDLKISVLGKSWLLSFGRGNQSRVVDKKLMV